MRLSLNGRPFWSHEQKIERKLIFLGRACTIEAVYAPFDFARIQNMLKYVFILVSKDESRWNLIEKGFEVHQQEAILENQLHFMASKSTPTN